MMQTWGLLVEEGQILLPEGAGGRRQKVLLTPLLLQRLGYRGNEHDCTAGRERDPLTFTMGGCVTQRAVTFRVILRNRRVGEVDARTRRS